MIKTYNSQLLQTRLNEAIVKLETPINKTKIELLQSQIEKLIRDEKIVNNIVEYIEKEIIKLIK